MKRTILTVLAVLSLVCWRAMGAVPELTKKSYEKRPADYGVVLVAVNWGRMWGVNGFQNAELREISFDLAGHTKADGDKADVVLAGPSGIVARIAAKSVFINYALLLPQGRYLMSGFDVKVARSASEVLHIKPARSAVLVDGSSKLGSFEVKRGEVVYIGNFYLDPAMEPFIWRYYSPKPEGFTKHLSEFHSQYPFLPLDNVAYRLFETTTIGESYPKPHLPEAAPRAKDLNVPERENGAAR